MARTGRGQALGLGIASISGRSTATTSNATNSPRFARRVTPISIQSSITPSQGHGMMSSPSNHETMAQTHSWTSSRAIQSLLYDSSKHPEVAPREDEPIDEPIASLMVDSHSEVNLEDISPQGSRFISPQSSIRSNASKSTQNMLTASNLLIIASKDRLSGPSSSFGISPGTSSHSFHLDLADSLQNEPDDQGIASGQSTGSHGRYR